MIMLSENDQPVCGVPLMRYAVTDADHLPQRHLSGVLMFQRDGPVKKASCVLKAGVLARTQS